MLVKGLPDLLCENEKNATTFFAPYQPICVSLRKEMHECLLSFANEAKCASAKFLIENLRLPGFSLEAEFAPQKLSTNTVILNERLFRNGHFRYPPPSAQVLCNILVALVNADGFYAATVDKMNALNLPSPFHQTPPIAAQNEDVRRRMQLFNDVSSLLLHQKVHETAEIEQKASQEVAAFYAKHNFADILFFIQQSTGEEPLIQDKLQNLGGESTEKQTLGLHTSSLRRLYIKNVPIKRCEDDEAWKRLLKQLLPAKLSRSIVQAQLFTRGKLRGQSFVHFASAKRAFRTKNFLHGLLLAGEKKPLLVVSVSL